MKFIDLATISVRAGDGGVGAVSFRREKYVPKGGPDGGNGGRGGSIIFRANRHLATLLDFQYRRVYKAPRGQHGLGSRKSGKSGEDLVIEVPVGTLVRDTANREILADFIEDGSTMVLARGGRGGRGNAEFATSTNQAPRTYEHGEPGEEREIELELKLLADVGLVGLPNAGKSTLISVISAARPKIADYPFTTLVPNLGIVRVEPGRSFVVADIPGLIEGAHAGRGLGVQFLRHIERTRVLAILLEATSESIKHDYEVLLHELTMFDRSLARKPRVVVLTKIDLVEVSRVSSLKRMTFGKLHPHVISAVRGDGIKSLVEALWKSLTAPARTGRQTP